MPKCNHCGKKFSYKRIIGKIHMIDGLETFFVPDETSNSSFVSRSRHCMKGRKAEDGQKGYKLHQCQNSGQLKLSTDQKEKAPKNEAATS